MDFPSTVQMEQASVQLTGAMQAQMYGFYCSQGGDGINVVGRPPCPGKGSALSVIKAGQQAAARLHIADQRAVECVLVGQLGPSEPLCTHNVA